MLNCQGSNERTINNPAANIEITNAAIAQWNKRIDTENLCGLLIALPL